MPTKREAWAGCLTLPRELLNAMVVCVSPVREAESLRGTCQPLHPVRLSGTQLLAEDAQAVELVLTWHTLDSQAEHYGIHRETAWLYVDNQQDGWCFGVTYPDEGLDGYRSIALPGAEYLTLRVFRTVHRWKCSLTMAMPPCPAVFTRSPEPAGCRYMQLTARLC